MGGGNEFSGRVEVCSGGEWGTVCGTSASWGSDGALTVCRQLFGSGSGEFELVGMPLLRITLHCVCYLLTNIAFAAFDGFYGEGDGPVFSVRCSGTENRLDECTIGTSDDRLCRHSQDGGAICAGIQVNLYMVVSTT